MQPLYWNHSEWNTSLLNIEDTVCSHSDIELNPNLHLGLVPRPLSASCHFMGREGGDNGLEMRLETPLYKGQAVYPCTWPLRQCSCEHDWGGPECGPPANLAWAGMGKGGGHWSKAEGWEVHCSTPQGSMLRQTWTSSGLCHWLRCNFNMEYKGMPDYEKIISGTTLIRQCISSMAQTGQRMPIGSMWSSAQ